METVSCVEELLLFLIIHLFIYTSKKMSEDFRDGDNVKRMCSVMFSTPGPIDFCDLSSFVTKKQSLNFS